VHAHTPSRLSSLLSSALILTLSPPLSSFFSLLQALLGEFDFDALREANPYMGPVVFIAFIVLSVFVVLNMLIAIISDAYQEAKDEAERQTDLNLPELIGDYLHQLLLDVPVFGWILKRVEACICTGKKKKSGSGDQLELAQVHPHGSDDGSEDREDAVWVSPPPPQRILTREDTDKVLKGHWKGGGEQTGEQQGASGGSEQQHNRHHKAALRRERKNNGGGNGRPKGGGQRARRNSVSLMEGESTRGPMRRRYSTAFQSNVDLDDDVLPSADSAAGAGPDRTNEVLEMLGEMQEAQVQAHAQAHSQAVGAEVDITQRIESMEDMLSKAIAAMSNAGRMREAPRREEQDAELQQEQLFGQPGRNNRQEHLLGHLNRPASAMVRTTTRSARSPVQRPASAAIVQGSPTRRGVSNPAKVPLQKALEYHAEQLCLGVQLAIPGSPSVHNLADILRQVFLEIEAEQRAAATTPASQGQVHALQTQLASLSAKLDAVATAKLDKQL
jgi:hypothetical protein